MGKLHDLIGSHLFGSAAIALDEGGVRFSWSRSVAYVRWTILADVTVEEGGRLRLIAADGEEVVVKHDHPDTLALHREILVQLAEVRAAAGVPDLPAPFARGDRALDAWLDAVRGLVHGDQAYRAIQIDRALLVSVLANEYADVDARAAAAHALLGEGDEHELVVTAKTFVLRALPPVVLVATRLAHGGAAIVDDEILSDAARFLSEADRAVVDARRADRDPARETQVISALERAKSEVLDEVLAAQEVSVAPSKWRRMHGLAGASASSWIGRTWSL